MPVVAFGDPGGRETRPSWPHPRSWLRFATGVVAKRNQRRNVAPIGRWADGFVGGLAVTGLEHPGTMAREIDGAIAERARKQFGLVTTEQARDLGMTDRQRQRRVQAGVLVPMGHHTFRIAGVAATWEVRLRAACLEAGSGAVVSHLAAAAWWGFERIGPGAVEVTTPRNRSARNVHGVVHRPRWVLDGMVTVHRALPVTKPERTMIDISNRLTTRRLECALDDALRRRLIDETRLRLALAAMPARHRTAAVKLGRLLDVPVSDGRRSTWLERQFVALAKKYGVPVPQLQAPISARGRLFYVDGLYDWAALVVELDGHGTHATRRERQADAERAALLSELGLRLIRFTYEDVTERPGYVAETILRHLARCGAVWQAHPTVSG